MTQFERYIGIDYSGAETPTSSLKGLRVYDAGIERQPDEVPPPTSFRKYWTRRGFAEWLHDQILKPGPTIVGIDHAFSFPLEHVEMHGLPLDWYAFLEDFRHHWPTHEDHVYVDFIRDELRGDGPRRMGDASWFRLTERWTAAAKSVFRFDVQGAVAKSTHSGLPWLLYLKERCGDSIVGEALCGAGVVGRKCQCASRDLATTPSVRYFWHGLCSPKNSNKTLAPPFALALQHW